MKSFFKFLLASTLGVLIASLIMFFITVGILTAMIASADKPTNIKSNSILLLKLDKPINQFCGPLINKVYPLFKPGMYAFNFFAL